MIKLGDEVIDSVTGFKGIAIGETTWLYGCKRVIVQPKGLDKDGKIFDTQSFDEPQLILVKQKKVKEGSHFTGGPRKEVNQKPNITRL